MPGLDHPQFGLLYLQRAHEEMDALTDALADWHDRVAHGATNVVLSEAAGAEHLVRDEDELQQAVREYIDFVNNHLPQQ